MQWKIGESNIGDLRYQVDWSALRIVSAKKPKDSESVNLMFSWVATFLWELGWC